MSDYSEFFLNTDSNVVELELISITHPNFTQEYHIVRNAMDGVTVTLEDSSVQEFEYYPLSITPLGASDDLDQILKITLGDLGEVLPMELSNVRIANGFATKPELLYRTYRSDDLTAPLRGPFRFELTSLSFDKQGATFEASAPRLNQNSTGERYTIDRFPMLQGFL